jgi:hypothetical protein
VALSGVINPGRVFGYATDLDGIVDAYAATNGDLLLAIGLPQFLQQPGDGRGSSEGRGRQLPLQLYAQHDGNPCDPDLCPVPAIMTVMQIKGEIREACASVLSTDLLRPSGGGA